MGLGGEGGGGAWRVRSWMRMSWHTEASGQFFASGAEPITSFSSRGRGPRALASLPPPPLFHSWEPWECTFEDFADLCSGKTVSRVSHPVSKARKPCVPRERRFSLLFPSANLRGRHPSGERTCPPWVVVLYRKIEA